MKDLSERIETINRLLRDTYGVDTVTGKPMWKVVWSEDELEKRLDTYRDYTSEGFFLREVYEAREVKRFSYIKDRYVLCMLQGVPDMATELMGLRMSYEPIWTFEDRNKNYLPPYFEGCQFIINTVYEKLGKKAPPEKHPDSGKDSEQLLAEKADRVNRITDELFGDQSQITERFGDTVILNSSGKLQ